MVDRRIYGPDYTADELHHRVIESLRGLGEHMGWPIEQILDKHLKRPLEQTIEMLIMVIRNFPKGG